MTFTSNRPHAEQRLARGFGSGPRAVRVVVPLSESVRSALDDPFCLSMIGHLADELTQCGYAMLLHTALPPVTDWLSEVISSGRAAGIIVIGQGREHEGLEKLARAYRSLVVWGAPLGEPPYCTVSTDDVIGARTATEYLLRNGRRRIVFLGDVETPERSLRYEGYQQALVSGPAGTAPPRIIPNDLLEAIAQEAAGDIGGKRVPFDAVVVASDAAAIGLIRTLKASGLHVPGNVAVVGFGDIPSAAHCDPTLTTIRQDAQHGARALVDVLLQRIAGEDPRSVVIPTKLVVRESTRPS